MSQDFAEYRELLSLQSEIRLTLTKALADTVCPQCGEDVRSGYGTGRMADGLFCSLGCFAGFRAQLIDAHRRPELN